MNARSKAVLMVSALAVIAACKKDDKAGEAVAAETAAPAATLGASDIATASRVTLRAGASLSGPLTAKVSVVLGAPIAEQIAEMFVNEGDAVRQGQPVARFRDDVLRSAAASARADLASTRSLVNVAIADSVRAVALFAEGAIAKRDHDNYLSQLESARARFALAESQAASAADRLETATLKAPVSGVVSERNAQAGDRVDFGKPVMTIVNNSTLQLEAAVESRWLGDLRVGRPVALTVSGTADTILGRVSRINPTADPATRQVRIYVDIPNTGNRLVGGLYVAGRVILDEKKDAVAVPRAALRYEGTDRAAVVYVVASGRVARRAVTVGIEDSDRGMFEILTGVSAGESVIVGPVDGIADGMRVDVAGAAAGR
jgi:RND family efflux transporter MFP subunit